MRDLKHLKEIQKELQDKQLKTDLFCEEDADVVSWYSQTLIAIGYLIEHLEKLNKD